MMAKATTDTERAEIAVREMGEMFKIGWVRPITSHKTHTEHLHNLGLIKPTTDGTEIC